MLLYAARTQLGLMVFIIVQQTAGHAARPSNHYQAISLALTVVLHSSMSRCLSDSAEHDIFRVGMLAMIGSRCAVLQWLWRCTWTRTIARGMQRTSWGFQVTLKVSASVCARTCVCVSFAHC
jgi:hypothetical protein